MLVICGHSFATSLTINRRISHLKSRDEHMARGEQQNQRITASSSTIQVRLALQSSYSSTIRHLSKLSTSSFEEKMPEEKYGFISGTSFHICNLQSSRFFVKSTQKKNDGSLLRSISRFKPHRTRGTSWWAKMSTDLTTEGYSIK